MAMESAPFDSTLRIGARGSPLSLAQTGGLRGALAAAWGLEPKRADTLLPIVPVVTTGDRVQDRALAEAGGKGLFVKELDEALLDGRIDCAVHSMKDLPTELPPGVVLLEPPARADRRDVLASLAGWTLEQLPEGALIGTASLRRAAQLRHVRPDLRTAVLRGNVGTRLAKLRDGQFDATILAAAGLARLGLKPGSAEMPGVFLDPDAMPPAAGQGALAVTIRAGDKRVAEAFAPLACTRTSLEIAAERAFLAALDGSCRTALGIFAHIDPDGGIELIGEVLAPDGAWRVRGNKRVDRADMASAATAGRELGAELRAQAAGMAGSSG